MEKESKTTIVSLSEKLYVDKNGKRFAYVNDIQKAVRELRKEFGAIDENDSKGMIFEGFIDRVFGDKLI